jgi:hypothetical protein
MCRIRELNNRYLGKVQWHNRIATDCLAVVPSGCGGPKNGNEIGLEVDPFLRASARN